jgi:hypothetical protein
VRSCEAAQDTTELADGDVLDADARGEDEGDVVVGGRWCIDDLDGYESRLSAPADEGTLGDADRACGGVE